jgi:hypothetical protein
VVREEEREANGKAIQILVRNRPPAISCKEQKEGQMTQFQLLNGNAIDEDMVEAVLEKETAGGLSRSGDLSRSAVPYSDQAFSADFSACREYPA